VPAPYERVLAQEGRFARLFGPVTSQMRASVTSSKPVGTGTCRGQHAVVLDEGTGLPGLQRLLARRDGAAADLEVVARPVRAHVALLGCDLGEARLAIELASAPATSPSAVS